MKRAHMGVRGQRRRRVPGEVLMVVILAGASLERLDGEIVSPWGESGEGFSACLDAVLALCTSG